MAYYRTCPKCGCNLDPGEVCDCEHEKEVRAREIASGIRREEGTNQYAFNFDEWEDKLGEKMCI